MIYGFHKGRFYIGMVYFPTVGFERMQEVMTRKLGQPSKPDNTPSKLIWDSEMSPSCSLWATAPDVWSICTSDSTRGRNEEIISR